MDEEIYICPACGYTDGTSIVPEHCPQCLSSYHEVDEDDNACGGIFEPISIWIEETKRGRHKHIIQRCEFCGALQTSEITGYDNPVKLLSVAAKPIGNPPFPVERMEELTMLMGGQGSTEGYYEE
ncbi:RNHCP domain-containing protein [Lachnospiraceae bacterium C10]|jgi:hypothetical protein|nr:RNHCP domain-containing protein [Lachnospiraceae bacterium C10]SDX05134.1 RNHCP domain-containing protein [Lachnospiraceae bacterium KHCPX20]